MRLPGSINICEVGFRDGLQNEKTVVATEKKVRLIDMIQNAGIKQIEIGSLVNPKYVPQMADTEDVYRQIGKLPGVEYRVLALNLKGLQRAIASGIKKVKITVSVSESHQRRNSNSSLSEVFEKFGEMAECAKDNDITLSGALATSFGCPFEGKVELSKIADVVKEYLNIGVYELSLSDTIGVANPKQVYETCCNMKDMFPDVVWNLHFHDTRGMGLANVLAGMQAEVTRFDASLGGLGGCPFAPGATGNIATEDLVHMCSEMGVKTGVNLDALIKAARELQTVIGHELSGALIKIGKAE